MRKCRGTSPKLESYSKVGCGPIPTTTFSSGSGDSKRPVRRKQSPVRPRVLEISRRPMSLLEDLDKFSNYFDASTAVTESDVTDTSDFTSAWSVAAETIRTNLGDSWNAPPREAFKPNYFNVGGDSEDSEEEREDEIEERVQYYRQEDLNYPDEDKNEDDYGYETLTDETAFWRGLSGYQHGCTPPVIHDVSPSYTARRKFSDEQIPDAINEYDFTIANNSSAEDPSAICANCGGRKGGCGDEEFCI